MVSAADYRECTTPVTAAATVPATTTPTVSSAEGMSTAPGPSARAFSSEQIEIVKQH